MTVDSFKYLNWLCFIFLRCCSKSVFTLD